MPRGRPIVTPLTLTPEQVTSLTQIANSRTAEHRQVQRARILLAWIFHTNLKNPGLLQY